MPISDIKKNEDLADEGKLVIRKEVHMLRIKHYRKSLKPGTSGACGYGWATYRTFENVNELNIVWKELLANGAIEG